MQLVNVDAVGRTLKNQNVDKTQVAENIRTGRARLRLTKVQFAQKAGISTNTLRALEHGTHTRMPDVKTLQKVANALEFTIEQLLGGKMAVPPHDPILARLHREDLRIADAYHEAIAEVKLATKHFLFMSHRSEDIHERLAILLQQLLKLPPGALDAIESFIEKVVKLEPQDFELLRRSVDVLMGDAHTTDTKKRKRQDR
jgi:transcriptional regulator with XRE-family HTH domain